VPREVVTVTVAAGIMRAVDPSRRAAPIRVGRLRIASGRRMDSGVRHQVFPSEVATVAVAAGIALLVVAQRMCVARIRVGRLRIASGRRRRDAA
jgi:hypothetical protein